MLWIDLPRLRDGADISDVVPALVHHGRDLRVRPLDASPRRGAARPAGAHARLETEHEAAVAAVVAEERARIARELHDLVAHALAVIVVQAQAGARVVGPILPRHVEALSSIESVGREGLVELRRLLDVLDPVDGDADASRPGPLAAGGACGPGPRRRAPGRGGRDREPRSLPPGLDLSAYRIVQEALTNTLKHAGPARSRVAVHYLPQALEVEVTDDGRTRPAHERPGGPRADRHARARGAVRRVADWPSAAATVGSGSGRASRWRRRDGAGAARRRRAAGPHRAADDPRQRARSRGRGRGGRRRGGARRGRGTRPRRGAARPADAGARRDLRHTRAGRARGPQPGSWC